MDVTSRDLLNADELLAEPLMPTRWTKRLAIMFIDLFFFYIIVLPTFFILALINPTIIDVMANINPLVERLVVTLLLVTYYILFEGLLGKTPGKLITRTKVVTTEGETPTLTQLIGRNLARVIPLDALTFIRSTPVGMHDRLAGTLVVDDRPRRSFDQSMANLSE
ncbi:hypothetical protein GCM10027341_15770 [Spirosoma knui]